jgi:signal transduction histidine kinase
MDIFNSCFEISKEGDVRVLAFYSHLLPIVVSLIIGSIVVFYARNRDKAMLFFAFTILLSLWLVGNLITWTVNDYYLVAGFWSTLDYLNVLFYLFIFYFAVFDFTKNQKTRRWAIALGVLASVVPFIITFAGLAVGEFDEPNCEMVGNEWLALYKLGFEWIIILAIIIMAGLAIVRHRKEKSELRRIILTAISTAGFLAIFSGSEFLSTYTEIYEINLYALFALPVFILLLAVSIFEMHTFRLRLDSLKIMQVLFVVFVLITISNLYVSDGVGELMISATGAIVTLGFGLLVYRGANKESEQRKKIENLALNLERANVRLKALDIQKSEFVSIASHQLRSPITSIRGYSSLILENSYGPVPPDMIEPLQRIEQSSMQMAMAIEDYLNVSRIESGNMKYNYSDFNLRDEVEHVCDDLRDSAAKLNLTLLFKTDLNSRGVVHADIGKTIQVIQNIVQNALKYTREGSVTVFVRDSVVKKKIYIDVIDTGIGMSTDTMHTIFQKFERAENANSINVHGTGLGLYVASKMADAMGGSIIASSEGDNKGSRFTIEFPLSM